MSKNFQWTTEEETDWAERTPAPSPAPPKRPLRRRRGVWLVLLPGILGLLFHQIYQRVTAVTADVEAEILSSQVLLEQAESREDVELFTTVLSGRDAHWTAVQQSLFQQDLLWGQSLGLSLLAAPPEVISVTVAPDLQSAEMLVERQYTTGEADAPVGVTLTHSLTFRRGESRWLLAPPSDAFWGAWRQAGGYYVTLIYPERDEAIALRLLREMDGQVRELCRFEPAAECPSGWQLLVRLDTDPTSLTAVTDAERLFSANPVFELPTPSLVGLPIDDIGYAALAQVYISQVVDRAIFEVVAGAAPSPWAAG